MKKSHQLPNGTEYDVYVEDLQHIYEKCVIYYHGGGLIYGTKGDIPAAFQNIFLEAGFTVICMDYPLAPNTPLSEILTTVYQNFLEIHENNFLGRPFLLAGRSGGSFLAFQLANYLRQQQTNTLKGLVNFYGYTNLDFIFEKNDRLSVVIPQTQLARLDQTTPIFDDPTFARGILYFDAAKKGNLSELYGVTLASKNQFALTKEELAQLPRSFNTASTTDEEVPFSYSKQIKRVNPLATFVPVYDLEHDFMKNSHDKQVLAIYQRLREWLVSSEI